MPSNNHLPERESSQLTLPVLQSRPPTCWQCTSAACMAASSSSVGRTSLWKGSTNRRRRSALALSTQCRCSYASSSSAGSRFKRTCGGWERGREGGGWLGGTKWEAVQ